MNHFYELNDNQQMLIVFIITMIISRPLWFLTKSIFIGIYLAIKSRIVDFIIFKVRGDYSSSYFGARVKEVLWTEKREGSCIYPDKKLGEYISSLDERIKALEEKK